VDVRLFLVIAVGSAVLALLARGDRRISVAIAFAGLAGCVAAALVMDEAASADLLGGSLVGSPYLRWFLVIASLAGLGACLVALVTRWQADLPAATLAALAGSALALSIDALPIALLAATAAGALGLISLAAPQAELRGSRVMLGYLQWLVLGGALAVVAAAWLVGPAGALGFDTLAGGAAALAMALALAIRLGAIPLHRPAARVVRTAVPLGIPLLLALLPVLVFLVALTWSHRILLGQAVDLGTIRTLITLAGAGTLLLGGLGTVGRPPESDDLEHVVSYGIVQDAGLFLLAFGAFDASVWEAARVWSLYFVVSKVGLAAWMASLIAIRGSSKVEELEGWARRSPLLALVLLAVVVTGLGLPGLDSWDARLTIIQSAAARPVRWLAYAGWALAYLPFIRLWWVGLRTAGEPLPIPARLRLRLPPTRPERRDVRAVARFVFETAQLSRLAIAVVLALIVGLGGTVLAFGPASLSEAAAVLPEPILPASSASP
jgi:formate hydrogenlyase subunit 3/multisubunit Na+/H+ antiporter MnhD subunit